MTALIQTDLREEDLDPEQMAEDEVNREHAGGRLGWREAHLMSLGNQGGAVGGVIDLGTGELSLHGVQCPERPVVRRLTTVAGEVYSILGDTYVMAPVIFEMERLFKKPVGQADLLKIFSDGRDMGEMEFVQEQRTEVTDWLTRYQARVAASKLQKPVVEADYRAKTMGYRETQLHPPQTLRRIFGQKLLQALQAASGLERTTTD